MRVFVKQDGAGVPYTPPDLKLAPAPIKGLYGYEWYSANKLYLNSPPEMQQFVVTPPRLSMAGYTRLRGYAVGGTGVTPPILTGKV